MRSLALVFALAIAPFSANALQRPSLKQAEISQIIGSVLTHKDVAMYLHPELSGRLPVKVAIAAPYSDTPIALVLYGKPVKVVDHATDAVHLAIAPSTGGITVRVSYRPEGMAGTVLLKKKLARWTVVSVDIHER